MPFTITASVNTNLPGSVEVGVVGDAGVVSSITRIDGDLPEQPVRNYDNTNSGIETVIDCEAPLGRSVTYELSDANGERLAASNPVTVPAPADGRSILRSVLKPQVAWAWVEPADEQAILWRSSTTAYDVIGSDTPVLVGEVRQRHEGQFAILCKTVSEANTVVMILRDGYPMLLRHSPCASSQTRDMLFYARNITESRVTGNRGWRLLYIDYQTTAFVPGDTLEPPSSWDFAALSASATDFSELTSNYLTFADMALNNPRTTATQGWGLF